MRNYFKANNSEELYNEYGRIKVEVYRNLHQDCFSVRIPNGRVIAHAKNFNLSNVTFKVSQVGRNKVLARKAKLVHAFVVGYISKTDLTNTEEEVYYNPYKQDYFSVNEEKVEALDSVFFKDNNKVYVSK